MIVTFWLHCPSVLAHCLSIRALNLLIIAVLNSWSYNPNIPAIYESGFDASSVYLNSVFCLSCNFFDSHACYTGQKRTAVKKPSGTWGVDEGEGLYSPMVRSQSLVSLHLWTTNSPQASQFSSSTLGLGISLATHGRVEGAGVECFPCSSWKSRSSWSWVLSFPQEG